MQYFLLALSIMSLLKSLRDGGDVDSSLDSVLPGLVTFFSKGEVNAEELALLRTALKDFVALLKS